MADGRVVDAMEGMDGTGRLIVRTARGGDRSWSRSATTVPASPRQPRARHLLADRRPARHHGDLRFTSAPGDTRFQVLLPLIQNG